jgi:hypothetical protein
VITGNLSRTPFAHVLLYVRDHGLSGTLAVWPSGASDEAVAAGTAPERPDRLYFSAGARKKGKLAQAASSLDRGLLPLFQRPDGPFVFYPDADYVGDAASVQPAEGSDLALLAASTRGPVRDEVIDSVLARFADAPMRLRPDADVRALELLPREQVVLDVLRSSPAPIAELVEHGGMEPRAARKILYLLAITKTIEPAPARPLPRTTPSGVPRTTQSGVPSATSNPASVRLPSPPSGSVRLPSPPSDSVRLPSPPTASAPESNAGAPSAPPAGAPLPSAPRGPRLAERAPEALPPAPSDLSPEHRLLWDELVARARGFDEQNFFEMLGIDSMASSDAATAAYFEIVKRLHPDRLPPTLAPLTQVAQQIFSVLTDARDTLSEEKSRLRYVGIVRDGGGTPAAQRKLEQTIEGTMEFQKADVLRKSDAAAAEQHVRRAIELDPEQADYYALLAWILFERYPGDGAPLDEMLGLVEKAIAMHDKHAKAHYYRGAILRRCGRENDAVKAFRRAVELNPKNVDAQREVRIATMRAKKGGGSAASSDTSDGPDKPEAPKTGAQRDVGELFKSLFSSKKK